MMKRLLLLGFGALFSQMAMSQTADVNKDFIGQPWQQEVNYIIQVKLDDVNHVLHAQEQFEYINNSPKTLKFLYVHLWPNAYKNKGTALAKQLMKGGKDFLFRKDPEYQGFIDSLDFRSEGASLVWSLDQKNIDICKITLAKPLFPGEKVVITTPFRVKLPSGEISRMGHIGQSYQITQWYPKPAVFDKNGWHQMPYLNQGEFYSEFGSFDVSITLPENYTIGSTGDLQTERELKRLDLLAEYCMDTAKLFDEYTLESDRIRYEKYRASDIPQCRKQLDWSVIDKHFENDSSSDEWKTVRYTQSKVHDFAWFADKSFRVQKGEVALPNSAEKVTTWIMYTNPSDVSWSQYGLEYIHDGTFYYSKWNGNYPYKQVTAVDGTISAGGGMEYPNVTVIGSVGNKEALEVVIVHEVGHNWFYGILGSNERDYGWMDEGLNTLNEMRYVAEKYPTNARLGEMLGGATKLLGFEGYSHKDEGDVLYRCMASFGIDQPIHTHSADFSSANYGGVMYQKTGLVFHYLKAYLGDSLFDVCMQAYFDRWKFKHPQPEDFRSVLEEVSGKRLDWLFVGLINERRVADYKISHVRQSKGRSFVTVKSVGQLDGPVVVQRIKNGAVAESVWVSPSANGKKYNTVELGASQSKFGVQRGRKISDTFVIDENRMIPEVNRNNNVWTGEGRKTTLKFGTGNDLPWERNHYWLPAVGWNQYDKAMLGVVLHNTSLPAPKWRYSLVPMYSFGRKNLSGMGDISYNPLAGKRYKSLRIGITAMTFQYDETQSDGIFAANPNHPRFAMVKPYVLLELGKSNRRNGLSHFLELNGLIDRQQQRMSTQPFSEQDGILDLYALRLIYSGKKRGATTALEYKTTFDGVSQFGQFVNSTTGRVQAEAKLTWNYIAEKKKARSIELRGYLGRVGMLSAIRGPNHAAQTENMYLMLSGASGKQDVFYDQYFRGRNSAPTSWNNSLGGQYDFTTNGQQRMDNMGGMGTAIFLGSANGLTAVNFSMSLLKVPSFVRLFYDYAIAKNAAWSFQDAGLMFRTGLLQVTVPLWMSRNLLENLGTIDKSAPLPTLVMPTYKQQLQRGVRFSLNIPLNSGLFLRKSVFSTL